LDANDDVTSEPDAQSRDELVEALEAVRIDPEAGKYSVRTGEAFDDQSLGVVRRGHAEAAVQVPDGLGLYEYAENRMFIATQAVRAKDEGFVLVVLGGEQGKRREIDSAFRLYCADEEALSLAANPSEAFATFLARHGLLFTSGGRRVRFVPAHIVEIPRGAQDFDVFGEMGINVTPLHEITVSMSMKLSSDRAQIAWPFVLDRTSYREELARHGVRAP
jgi:hypothetical protein